MFLFSHFPSLFFSNRYQKCQATVKPLGKNGFNLVVSRVFEEGERELEAESGDQRLPELFEFAVGATMQLEIVRDANGARQLRWRDLTPRGIVQYKLDFSEDTQLADFEAFIVDLGRALFTVLNGVPPTPEEASYDSLVALFKQSGSQPAARGPAAAPQPAAPQPAAPQSPVKSSLYPTLESSPVKPSAPAARQGAAQTQLPASAFHDAVAADAIDDAAGSLPPRVSVPTLAGETVANVPCVLRSLNPRTQAFDVVCERCAAVITKTAPYEFGLFVLDLKGAPADLKDAPVVLGQRLGNEMNAYFDMAERTITWTYRLGASVWVWSAVFPDPAQDIAFKDVFSRCLYETTSRKPFGKVKEEDKVAIMNTLRDTVDRDSDAMDPVEPDTPEDRNTVLEAMDSLSLRSSMSDVGEADEEDHRSHGVDLSDEEEEDDEEEESEEEEDEDRDEEEDEDEDEDRPTKRVYKMGSKNRLLNVSAKHHRALVCRGKKIGIFSAADAKKGLHFETCISGFEDKKGETFAPRRMMLHHGEDQLLMLHPDEKRKVLEMDLNRGDVVQEWGVDDYPINEILPQSKYAPQTMAQTVVGMNRVGFFMMDPRLPDQSKIVTDKSFFSLAGRAPGFSCAATTANGEVVLGTESGEVRLYDSKMLAQGKPGSTMEDRQPRAKTTFIGFGDPIRGIDVTQDGAWIVATCATYLLLIKTVDAAGNSGFVKPLGKNKIAPRRLHLKPQHLRLLGGTVDFTPAKFDLGDDTEKSIVTSSGQYVITWDFRKAKQNKLDYYRIVRLNNAVVADQFRFGDSDTVVVAMPDDVTIARNVLPPGNKRV